MEVIQGTCGWSDTTLVDCGRFYPKKTMSSADKLAVYSRKGLFGCVEVDSSNYNIPKVESVAEWVKATPPGFVFHFKAFGLLVNGSMAYSALPRDIREGLGSQPPNKRIALSQIGDEQVQGLWDRFHRSLQPAIAAGKMGAVVFQFQLNVVPSPEAMEHVEYCARKLLPGLRMAVEFRNRLWLSEQQLPATTAWLGALRDEGVALIACDDLASEVYGKPQDLLGDHLPVVLTAQPCAAMAYVRVHRREGCERVLSDREVADWAQRIAQIYSDGGGLRGPLHFLWGTDHEDQPMTNAAHLCAALTALRPDIAPKWADRVRAGDKQSIRASFFRQQAAAAEEVQDNGNGDDGMEVKEVAAAKALPAVASPLKSPGSRKRGIGQLEPAAGKQAITSFFKKK